MTKTALITWELGGGLGHLSTIHAIVKSLQRLDYKIFVAVKDVSQLHQFFADTNGVTFLQAPIWLTRIKMNRPAVCLADVLFLKGYLHRQTLRSLIQTWRGLFDLVKPDLLICNYSPTAMLASYGQGFARMVVGTGYAEPAPGMPIADWRGNDVQDNIVSRQEQQLLELIKDVVPEVQKISQYSEIFECESTIITTLPPLDLYAQHRKDAKYCVKNSGKKELKRIKWKQKNLPRILVYLHLNYAHRDLLLEALEKTGAEVFVVAPNAHPDIFRPFLSERYNAANKVVDIVEAFSKADLFVGHGNMGTLSEALCQGVPVVTLPVHLENKLNGKLVSEFGAGVLVTNPVDAKSLADLFVGCLNNSELKAKAREMADQAKGIVQNALDECLRYEIKAL